MIRLVSRDPASHEKLGSVPVADRAAVERAVERARFAQREWASRPIAERAAIIARAADLLTARTEATARLITREEGKPLKESRTEASNTADRIRYFAEKGPSALQSREEPVRGCRGIVDYRPLGVVAAIKPWNFPVNIPAWSITPALLAGNAVVFKPSELTPLCGAALAKIFHEAGVPSRVLQVVQGGDATGKALVASDVNMIAFVGSQAGGRAIAAKAAPEFKQLELEMGGKDPAIVLADADIERAASLLTYGAFKNCGQVCCSCERIYVEKPIFARFVDALVDQTRSLKIGYGLEDGVEVGPLIRVAERDRVEAFIRDALRRGARVECGATRPDLGLPGAFFAPTILTRVPDDALMMRREIFGPAVPVIPVKNADEAVRRANALPFGLTATVWTSDTDRGVKLARRIEAGTIAVNANTGSIVQHPWGGMKSSGLGRMLGLEGIRSFAQVVTVRVPES